MRLIHYKPSLADKIIQHIEPIINPSRNIHPTNIIEKEKEFIIEIAAPGFEKKNFKITIENTYLVISGTICDKTKDQDDNTKNNSINYLQREFINQNFEKSFSLGTCSIDDKNISAKYEKGILFITVPKKQKSDTPSRSISVN